MTVRRFHLKSLDVSSFASQAGSEEGERPLAEFRRLATSLLVPADGLAGEVRWQVQGRQQAATGSAPQVWLDLSAQAQVPLQCQRCLQPMLQALTVERSFRFVRDEARAAEEDEISEEEVLALTPKLNLADLIEDELILELPLVPRHQDCALPMTIPAMPQDAAAASEVAGRGAADGRGGERSADPTAPADAPAAGERQYPFAGLAALTAAKRSGRG